MYSYLQVFKMPLPHSPVPASHAVLLEKLEWPFLAYLRESLCDHWLKNRGGHINTDTVRYNHLSRKIMKCDSVNTWDTFSGNNWTVQFQRMWNHTHACTHITSLIYFTIKVGLTFCWSMCLLNTCNFWLFLWIQNKCTHVLPSRHVAS